MPSHYRLSAVCVSGDSLLHKVRHQSGFTCASLDDVQVQECKDPTELILTGRVE